MRQRSMIGSRQGGGEGGRGLSFFFLPGPTPKFGPRVSPCPGPFGLARPGGCAGTWAHRGHKATQRSPLGRMVSNRAKRLDDIKIKIKRGKVVWPVGLIPVSVSTLRPIAQPNLANPPRKLAGLHDT